MLVLRCGATRVVYADKKVWCAHVCFYVAHSSSFHEVLELDRHLTERQVLRVLYTVGNGQQRQHIEELYSFKY